MKIIFSEKKIKGAFNHPENSKKPETQLRWVLENVTKETVSDIVIVTCSMYILQACLHMVEKFNDQDNLRLFNEKKECTGESGIIFDEMAEPMRKVLFDKV